MTFGPNTVQRDTVQRDAPTPFLTNNRPANLGNQGHTNFSSGRRVGNLRDLQPNEPIFTQQAGNRRNHGYHNNIFVPPATHHHTIIASQPRTVHHYHNMNDDSSTLVTVNSSRAWKIALLVIGIVTVVLGAALIPFNPFVGAGIVGSGLLMMLPGAILLGLHDRDARLGLH